MSRAETDKKVRELFDRRLAESKSQTLVGKTREEVLNQIEKMKKYYVPDIPEEFAGERIYVESRRNKRGINFAGKRRIETGRGFDFGGGKRNKPHFS